MVTNTYFLGSCSYFMGVSGYDGGYFAIPNVEVQEKDEYDEEEEE